MDKIDFTSLGADLGEAKWSARRLQETSSSQKQSPTLRKRRAATVKTHATKLFAVLGPAVEETVTRDQLCRGLCGLQQYEDLPPLPLRVEAFAEFLDIFQLLALDANQALSAAGAEAGSHQALGGLSASLARGD